jgi:NitT/TauT family transport system substrate-binding protein
MARTPGRVTAALVGMGLALVTACAPPAPQASAVPPAASPVPAAAARAERAPEAAPPPLAQTVHLGVLNAASDAGFFIAQDLGYFREQGLELDMPPFDSAARMVAPLGAGQLEIGGGAHSAGLFNAVARGVDLRLVADKGSSPPGYGFQGLAFRRDLAESGELRAPADLRARRVALPARGITTEVALAGWLRQGGLSLSDVEVVELGFPDHVTAMGSGAVDASVTIEPFLTRILGQQLGTLYQRTDELLPGYQIAEVIYSGAFIREQPDAARRFLIAYLKAVRYYNDAFSRNDAAKRQEAVSILTRNTTVKDAALYDRMVMPGLAADGRMNLASLAEDQEFWLATGLQQARVSMDDVVDHSFADAAAQVLGPYR